MAVLVLVLTMVLVLVLVLVMPLALVLVRVPHIHIRQENGFYTYKLQVGATMLRAARTSFAHKALRSTDITAANWKGNKDEAECNGNSKCPRWSALANPDNGCRRRNIWNMVRSYASATCTHL